MSPNNRGPNQNYSSDILMTIKDSRVYRKDSNYSGDILATIRDNQVYSGTSNYHSDIEYTIDGNLSVEEFVAVWYVVYYCY